MSNSEISDVLRQFSISPEQLDPEKLNKLMKFSTRIQDPSQITPELATELMQILGVSANPPSKPRQSTSTKIGRNDRCPCKSGKKWKKCCLNKHT
jgi:uncharacterized protein YecA (UPF0149 family)